MKRYLYLFPLMAFTAATLALGACDDNKEEAVPAEQTMVAPETTTADAIVAPATATTITTMDAKAFATAPGATNGAVFVTLQNTGTETDKLVGASTPVASIVEIHETSMDPATNTMQMRKVDGVEIGAGQQATLTPDGYHIMLMGLTAPLTEGQSFDITLDFDKSADVIVPVTVTTAGLATEAAAPATNSTTPETMTPPADATMPTETTPTTETPADATVAPTTDVPTGAAPGSLETPATEDTMEEPTTAQ